MTGIIFVIKKVYFIMYDMVFELKDGVNLAPFSLLILTEYCTFLYIFLITLKTFPVILLLN